MKENTERGSVRNSGDGTDLESERGEAWLESFVYLALHADSTLSRWE